MFFDGHGLMNRYRKLKLKEIQKLPKLAMQWRSEVIGARGGKLKLCAPPPTSKKFIKTNNEMSSMHVYNQCTCIFYDF